MESIITAIISSCATLLVCLINNHFQNRANNQKHAETVALIEYKLEELTKKTDKHNTIIERTYELEKARDVFEEKLRVANHRIDDLERGRYE